MTPAEEAELIWRIRREAKRLERFTWVSAMCTGKARFADAQAARRAIHAKAKGLVAPYRCNWCDGFHLGGVNRRRRLLIEKRRAG